MTTNESLMASHCLALPLIASTCLPPQVPGFDMRTGIVAVVPKSHAMHTVVTALVEYVLMPPSQTEAQLNEVCKKMLRRVAVNNQENGRREFTSKNVACVLGLNPDELGLWYV